MRKFRTAAAVATLVTTFGALGAGTAAASGGPGVEFEQENAAACEQTVEQESASLIGDINVALGLGLFDEGEAAAGSDNSVEVECEIAQENEID